MSDIIAMQCQPQWIAAEKDDEGKPRLPRFEMTAYTGGQMMVAGFRGPIVVDLDGMQIPAKAIPIRLQHDVSRGIGHTDAVSKDGGQLVASGIVSRRTVDALEVVESGVNGFPWQASIGASADRLEVIKAGQPVSVNGQDFVGPLTVVRESKLSEISFVDLGADGATSATIAAEAATLHQENSMTDIKVRKEELLAKHGEQHQTLILAALCDGKEDHEIECEIAAAQAAAIVAARDEAIEKAAALEAEHVAMAEQLAAARAEVDALKAQIAADEARRLSTPEDPGDLDLSASGSVNKETFAAMSPLKRSEFLNTGGKVL